MHTQLKSAKQLKLFSDPELDAQAALCRRCSSHSMARPFKPIPASYSQQATPLLDLYQQSMHPSVKIPIIHAANKNTIQGQPDACH
jgi:hypothetical protein